MCRHIDFFHCFISLFDFFGDGFGVFLQGFQCLNELAVVQDVSFCFCELVEKVVFELSQLDSEFALEFGDIASLFVDFWSFGFQEDVEAQILETRWSHSEVNERDS